MASHYKEEMSDPYNKHTGERVLDEGDTYTHEIKYQTNPKTEADDNDASNFSDIKGTTDDDISRADMIDIQQDSEVPDGGWGWFVVIGACLLHVLNGGFERSNGIVYLHLLEKYNRSATETTWVLSIFATLRLLAGPLASALVNRFSCRTVCFIGSCICTLGIVLSAFVPELHYLYFTYGFLGGLGRSMTYTTSLIIVGYYFNKKRGIAVGLATSGSGLGTLLFPPLFEISFDTFGHSWTFLILSAIISNSFVCSCLFRPLSLNRKLQQYDRRKKLRLTSHTNVDVEKELPEKDADNDKQPRENRDPVSVKDTEMTAVTLEMNANIKISARRPSLFRTMLDQFKLALKGSDTTKAEKRKFIDFSLFRNLAKEKGVPQIKGAYLVSLIGIFDGISRIGFSIILDFKRVKKYRLNICNLIVLVIGGVYLCLPSLTEFWQFCVIAGIYGMLSGAYISQKSVVCVDVLGIEKLSSSFGLVLLFQGVSTFVGPTVGAILKDRLGSYDMAFYVGSTGIFVGFLVMMAGNIWLHKQRKKQEAMADRE